MIRNRLRTSVALGAIAVGLSTIASGAQAQDYAGAPFFEWTLEQSQAIGLELASQRLRILQAVEPPYDDEFAEVVENLTGEDWERFGGTLATLDAEFAAELYELLDEIAEGVEDGEDVAELVPTGLDMLAQAYDMMFSEELRNDRAFVGGVMAQLLLGEGGVAEGLEEAFDEKWEFANGWAATQRIKVLWETVNEGVSDQMVADVEETFAAFDAIYPSPYPPESLAGMDPEEGETPAQRLVGFLETIVDAELYSGRDQLRLIVYLEEVAATACDLYEAGDDEVARESMYVVLDHYDGETTGLGELIGLFAPEVHQGAIEALDNLVEGGTGGAEACEALVEALGEGRAVLGG